MMIANHDCLLVHKFRKDQRTVKKKSNITGPGPEGPKTIITLSPRACRKIEVARDPPCGSLSENWIRSP
jgi:hypothetical protein